MRKLKDCIVSYRLGGNDPLYGISVYDSGSYWHFVTYGLTELYDKESDIEDVSGCPMEFIFKLKMDNYDDEELEISYDMYNSFESQI